jgi:hypothetical protein
MKKERRAVHQPWGQTSNCWSIANETFGSTIELPIHSFKKILLLLHTLRPTTHIKFNATNF